MPFENVFLCLLIDRLFQMAEIEETTEDYCIFVGIKFEFSHDHV